jgi:hypothetical protein
LQIFSNFVEPHFSPLAENMAPGHCVSMVNPAESQMEQGRAASKKSCVLHGPNFEAFLFLAYQQAAHPSRRMKEFFPDFSNLFFVQKVTEQ